LSMLALSLHACDRDAWISAALDAAVVSDAQLAVPTEPKGKLHRLSTALPPAVMLTHKWVTMEPRPRMRSRASRISRMRVSSSDLFAGAPKQSFVADGCVRGRLEEALASDVAPGDFDALKQTALDPKVQHSIDKDIPRTFPKYQWTTGDDDFQTVLGDVLRAFAAKHPSVGYCQGLNFIAGFLLNLTRDGATAFQLMERVMEDVGLLDFFTDGMPLLQDCLAAYDSMALRKCPRAVEALEEADIISAMYAVPWMACCFTTVFSTANLIDIFDVVFKDGGPAMVVAVCVSLLTCLEARLLEADSSDRIAMLRNPEDHVQCSQVVEHAQQIVAEVPDLLDPFDEEADVADEHDGEAFKAHETLLGPNFSEC